MNLVFIVASPSTGKTIIVKQAVPYVRCVGESWPLTLERAFFECSALREQHSHDPLHTPAVIDYDKRNALLTMEYVPPPHIILRRGLIQGISYPQLAEDVGTFMAKTLFNTSALKLDGPTFRKKVAMWSRNVELCALTEQVIFTDPYTLEKASSNHWTSPELDDIAAWIRQHAPLKQAAAVFKTKFVSSTEALLHADLHTGSIMATPTSTKVIDPEFAFYGPIGFDVGAVLANLLLNYFAQEGLGNGEEYAQSVLGMVEGVWQHFSTLFVQLWEQHTASDKASSGLLFPLSVHGEDGLKDVRQAYLKTLFADAVGFCGCKMVRRVVGIAHVADLDGIEDKAVRARAERRALVTGSTLIMAAASLSSSSSSVKFDSVADVTAFARQVRAMSDAELAAMTA